jgi:hypothetical protein
VRKWLKAVAWTSIALVVTSGALVIYAYGSLFLVLYGVIAPWSIGSFCVADTSVKLPNVGGFDFEFEDTNCDVIGNQQIMLVFVSRHSQHQRHVLLAYAAINGTPTATLVAPRTVRLSLGQIGGVYTKDDGWRELQMEYDYSMEKR